MPGETAASVVNEFATFLNDASAIEAFAALGLTQIEPMFSRLPTDPTNPDPDVFIGVGDPNAPDAEVHAQWKLSRALAEVAKDGPVSVRLGHQWIVWVFTEWEHEYRPRLARAHGRDKDDEKYPLLGDVRRLRHDVVHHRGTASSDHSAKCEVIKWFSAGDVIALRAEHYAEFHRLMPWAEMVAG